MALLPSPKTSHPRRLATAVALAAAASAGGCLFSSHSVVRRTGTDVPAATFDQVQPGQTTAAWVAATLGEPTTRHREGRDEVWTYAFTEHVDSDGYVFLIFGGSNVTDTTRRAFVEFQDGTVVRKWRG